MKASDLDNIIQLYELKTTKTDFGLTNNQYIFKLSCRARVNYSSGNRTIENDEIFYDVSRDFIVRSYVQVSYSDIIKYKDEFYQVISIDHSHDFNNIIIRTSKVVDSDPLNNIIIEE